MIRVYGHQCTENVTPGRASPDSRENCVPYLTVSSDESWPAPQPLRADGIMTSYIKLPPAGARLAAATCVLPRQPFCKVPPIDSFDAITPVTWTAAMVLIGLISLEHFRQFRRVSLPPPKEVMLLLWSVCLSVCPLDN